MGKTVTKSLNGENLKHFLRTKFTEKCVNEKIDPRGLSAPGLYTCIIVYDQI